MNLISNIKVKEEESIISIRSSNISDKNKLKKLIIKKKNKTINHEIKG